MKILLATGLERMDNDVKEVLGGDCDIAEVYYREAAMSGYDVVVLSPALPGNRDLADIIYSLRRDNTRVVLLAGNLGPEQVWQAFNLGVYDILFDPVRVQEIADAIRSPGTFGKAAELLSAKGVSGSGSGAIKEVERVVVKEIKKVTRQQVFCWWSASGGEGKTTLAASQAYQLAKKTGEKVALLDFKEVTPACSWWFDLKPFDAMPVFDAVEKGSLYPGVLEENMADYEKLPNLKVFTGVGLDRFGIFAEKHFAAVVEACGGFPYVVIDTNPGVFFAGTLVALKKSDFINVVVEPSYRSLEETRRMSEFVIKSWGVLKENFRVYVNKMTFGSLDHDILRSALKGLEIAAFFDYRASVTECLNKGVPVEKGFEALVSPFLAEVGKEGLIQRFLRGVGSAY